MKSVMKSFISAVFILTIVFGCLEIFFRINSNPENTVSIFTVPGSDSKNFLPVYKYFCDFHHKNALGQDLVKSCWDKSNAAGLDYSGPIWILGGSTSKANECNVENGWVKQIFENKKSVILSNFSQNSMTTDMFLKLILTNSSEVKPKFVVLSLIGIPEIQLYLDNRDLNYAKLVNKGLAKMPALGSKLILLALSISKTLELNSVFYHKLITEFMISKEDSISEFVEVYKKSNDTEMNDWDRAMSYMKISPMRYFLNSESLSYAVENYKLNFSEFKRIADADKIEFICVQQPFPTDIFKERYPQFNSDLTAWLNEFYKQTMSLCNKYGFKIVDAKKCSEE